MTQHISSDFFCPIDNKGKYKDCAPSFRCGVRISATTSGTVARLQIHMKTSLSYIISIIVLYSIVLSKFTNLGQTLLLYSYGAKMASILIDHIIHNLCNFCSAGHVDIGSCHHGPLVGTERGGGSRRVLWHTTD